MAEIVYGRRIATVLEEFAAPESTAVVVVDPQNDFIGSNGRAAQLGLDVELLRRPLPTIVRFVDSIRGCARLLVFLQVAQAPDGRWLSDAELASLLRAGRGTTPEWAIEGTWGQQFVPELQPHSEDMVVRKPRASGFSGTNLDQILRIHGISTVVFVGFTTSGCVMYTARDAMMHGYYVVVLSDCIGSQNQEWHDATLVVMKRLFHFVGPASQLLRAWGVTSEQ